MSDGMRCGWMAAALFLGGGVGVGVGGGVSSLDGQSAPTVLLEAEMTDRSEVALELHAGDYEVRRSADRRLRVMELREAGATGRTTKTHVVTKGGRVELEVDPPSGDRGGDHGHTHVILEVPGCTRIEATLTAGKMQVNDVPCTETSYSLHAGELDAQLGEPGQYSEVTATVTIGQVAAGAFDPKGEGEHGGIFPSYRWQGPGRRRFAVHVGTGEIRLAR